METNPHDRFARRAFSDVDVMRGHLRGFLPPEVTARLVLDALRREPDVHLDPALRDRLSDLVFSAPTVDGGDALVWFVFEHKSSPDRLLPYHLLRSATRISENWKRDHPDADGLPWIVPVVLYAGHRRFDVPRRYAALCALDAEGDSPVLGPDLRYHLTDLSAVDDDLIRRRVGDVAFGALAHLMLKHARDDDLLERLAHWAELLHAVLRTSTAVDLLRTLLTYVVSARGGVTADRVAKVLLPHLDALDREIVMSEFKSTADDLRAEGMERGRLEGMERGRQEGMERGRQEGMERGRQEGMERGRQRATADHLLRILRRRFDVPDGLAARIEVAPLADLERWFDRALDAETIEHVFGE